MWVIDGRVCAISPNQRSVLGQITTRRIPNEFDRLVASPTLLASWNSLAMALLTYIGRQVEVGVTWHREFIEKEVRARLYIQFLSFEYQ